MGQFEVTQGEYELFLQQYEPVKVANPAASTMDPKVDAVTYPTPLYEIEAGPILQRMGRRGKFPAVLMSHYSARQYTKWLSRKTGRFYRLPTEAEWEYACRAGTTTAYHFGDDPKALGDFAWTFENSALADGDAAYRPVGTKKPNPWGLYDMHGNVAEWVMDGHAEGHYASFGASGGPHDAAKLLRWPATKYPRVIRGGSYESDAEDCRSARRLVSTASLNKRDPNDPKTPYWESAGFWVGFRVVCPAREPDEAEKRKHWQEETPDVARILKQRIEREAREPLPPYP
jgi:formylglycine-generating enzyme required for sulfatase activity